MVAKRKQKAAPTLRKHSRSLQAIAGFVQHDDAQLQKLLADRVRLGVLSCLAVTNTLTFKELRELLDVSDGNLSTHARKLEAAGLLECEKSFQGRTPRTEYRITKSGKHALERHLAHMEALINATR